MQTALAALLGLLIGGVAGWLLATARSRAAARHLLELERSLAAGESTVTELRRELSEREQALAGTRGELQIERQARVEAATRLEEWRKHFEEQKRLLDDAEKRLKDAFAALSVEALRLNSEAFVKQAAEKVQPLAEALQRYDAEIKRVQDSLKKDYGGLSEQLKSIALTHQQLSQQTTSLVHALRTPQVKGRWGEMTLRRAVEVAGLSPHCDFAEQVAVETDEGRLRPDLIVHLPGGRSIVVDAKTPTSAYLDAVEAADASVRGAALVRHAAAMRQHLQNLASKRYWGQFEAAPEFVVLFVPGESFFSAALEQDRELIEEGIRNRVILASPTTLIALLRAVAQTWQQQEVIENARAIGQTARTLFERVRTFAEHLGRVGEHLHRAVDAYNASVGSWESRVLPMARRVTELGVSTDEQLPEVEHVDVLPRAVDAPAAADPAENRAGPSSDA